MIDESFDDFDRDEFYDEVDGDDGFYDEADADEDELPDSEGDWGDSPW